MYEIYNASMEDATLVTKIMTTSFKAAFSGFISSETIEECTGFDGIFNMFRNIFEEGSMKILVGNKQGILVWMKNSDEVAEIAAIHSLPESWGTGLGHELLIEGLKQMKEVGVKSVYLWAFKENVRARRFYEKHGLKWTGEERISEFDEAVEVRYEIFVK